MIITSCEDQKQVVINRKRYYSLLLEKQEILKSIVSMQRKYSEIQKELKRTDLNIIAIKLNLK